MTQKDLGTFISYWTYYRNIIQLLNAMLSEFVFSFYCCYVCDVKIQAYFNLHTISMLGSWSMKLGVYNECSFYTFRQKGYSLRYSDAVWDMSLTRQL